MYYGTDCRKVPINVVSERLIPEAAKIDARDFRSTEDLQ
jgi:hypothetical protein